MKLSVTNISNIRSNFRLMFRQRAHSIEIHFANVDNVRRGYFKMKNDTLSMN